MGRKTINDDYDENLTDYLISEGKRQQTDAEWHGELLESISSTQEDIKSFLEDINDSLRSINEYFERNPQPYIVQQNQTKPMATWRFIVSWVAGIFVVWLICAAFAS